MKARAMRCMVALVASAGVAAAAAETPPSACHVEASQVHPLRERENALSRFEQLPQHCLKELFMRCAAEANERVLDLGSAATCSIGYEALLKRGFAGDFHAFMAWWHTQRSMGWQD